MERSFDLFLLTVLTLSIFPCDVAGLCSCSSTAEAFRSLYEATGGATHWAKKWDTTSADAPCGFYGIVCSVTDGSVSIDLASVGLTGTLPDALSSLGALVTRVALSNNSLHGVLPSSYSSWTRITSFDIAFNGFTGSLPSSYASWTLMTEFLATENKFSGSIPSAFDAWRAMARFRVETNYLSGTLPPSLGLAWANSLREFAVAFSNISGSLPAEYSQWNLISVFSVEQTNINGTLPESYSSWGKSITAFHIPTTNISGTLPTSWSTWGLLTHFRAHETQLNGTVPDEYSNWTSLVQFYIADNPRLGGTLPEMFSAWKSIMEFSIPFCNFSGTLPVNYAQWGTSLSIIRVRGNQLIGTLPKEYSAWTNLTYFTVRENRGMYGTLPPEYAAWTKLGLIDTHNCSFSGTLPPEYESFSLIEEVRFSANNFSGSLPSAYGSWVAIINFVMDHNPYLGGALPKEYRSWTNCLQVYATDCALSGTLPSEYSEMKSMRVLSLANNKLTGTLPSSYAAWKNIEQVYLSQNDLTGAIPNAWPLAMCSTLVLLILAGNQLSGTIPSDFSTCSKMSVFAISQNNFRGQLPSSWNTVSMPKLVGLSLQDNPLLSGPIPSSWNGIVNGFIGLLFLCNTSICGSSLSISLPFGFACVPRDRVFEMYGLLSVATDAESYLLVRTYCSFNTSAPCNSSNSAQQTTPAPSSPTANAASSLEATPRAAAAGAVSLLGGIIIGALFPSVTGATLSPTAGGLPMIQGVLGVLRLRRRCAAAAFDDDGTDGNSSGASEMTTQQQLSVMDSPTQLCFDTLGPQTGCAAGAIVGNVALIVGVGCVIHVCAAYFRPWLRRSSMVVVTSPSSGVPAGGNTATPSSWLSVLRACLHRHLPDDRLPGSAYWTFSSLLQPTTAAAVLLFGPPASKSSTPIGVPGVIVIIVSMGWTIWIVFHGIPASLLSSTRKFPFVAIQQHHPPHHGEKGSRDDRKKHHLKRTQRWRIVYDAWAKRVKYPRWRWRPSHGDHKTNSHDLVAAACLFGSRYGACFTGYRGGWWRMFFVVELMTAVLCGVVLGIAEAMINSDSSECDNTIVWSSVSVAVISASLAALVTYFHPLGEKVGNVSLVLVSLLASASAACSAISNNDAATSCADGLAFAGGLVEAVLLVLGCASAFVGWLLSNASSREGEQSPLGRFDSAVDGAPVPSRHRAPSRKERHLDIPEKPVDEKLLAPLHIHPSGVSDSSSSREKVLAKLVRLAISAAAKKKHLTRQIFVADEADRRHNNKW